MTAGLASHRQRGHVRPGRGRVPGRRAATGPGSAGRYGHGGSPRSGAGNPARTRRPRGAGCRRSPPQGRSRPTPRRGRCGRSRAGRRAAAWVREGHGSGTGVRSRALRDCVCRQPGRPTRAEGVCGTDGGGPDPGHLEGPPRGPAPAAQARSGTGQPAAAIGPTARRRPLPPPAVAVATPRGRCPLRGIVESRAGEPLGPFAVWLTSAPLRRQHQSGCLAARTTAAN